MFGFQSIGGVMVTPTGANGSGGDGGTMVPASRAGGNVQSGIVPVSHVLVVIMVGFATPGVRRVPTGYELGVTESARTPL